MVVRRTNIAADKEARHVVQQLLSQRIRQSLHFVDVLCHPVHITHTTHTTPIRRRALQCLFHQPGLVTARIHFASIKRDTECYAGSLKPEFAQDERVLEHALDWLD